MILNITQVGNMKKLLIPISFFIFGCEKEEALPTPPQTPKPIVETKIEYRYDTLTSNEIRYLSTRWDNYHGKGLASWADLNNDGETDVIFIDDGIFIRTYKNGQYQSQKIEGVSFIFARSIIPFDANGDNYIDFVVLAHNNENIQPNPGEIPYLFINNRGNGFTPNKINVRQDFWHLGSAGDLDGDGDNDLIICTAGSVTYLNNVAGNFIEVRNVIPESYKDSHYVGCLIDDFNNDGYNDVLFYGHEYAILNDKTQLAKTRILFGNASGKFSETNSTTFKEDTDGFGVIIDAVSLDLNKDGQREIVLVRTGDPINFNFYKGYKIQIINLKEDLTNKFIDNPFSYSEGWICTIKFVDVNNDGKRDIVEWDKRRQKYFLQK